MFLAAILSLLFLRDAVSAQVYRFTSFPSTVVVPERQETAAAIIFWTGEEVTLDSTYLQYMTTTGSWLNAQFVYGSSDGEAQSYFAQDVRIGQNKYRLLSLTNDALLGELTVVGIRDPSARYLNYTSTSSTCTKITWNVSVDTVNMERYDTITNSWMSIMSSRNGRLFNQYFLQLRSPSFSNSGNVTYCSQNTSLTAPYIRLVDVKTNNTLDMLDFSNSTENPIIAQAMPRKLLSIENYDLAIPGTSPTSNIFAISAQSKGRNSLLDLTSEYFEVDCSAEVLVKIADSAQGGMRDILERHLDTYVIRGILVKLPPKCSSGSPISRLTQVRNIGRGQYILAFDFDFGNVPSEGELNSGVDLNIIWGTVNTDKKGNLPWLSNLGLSEVNLNWNYLKPFSYPIDFCQPLVTASGTCGNSPPISAYAELGFFGKASLNISYGIQIQASIFPQRKLIKGSAFLSYEGNLDLGVYADLKMRMRYSGKKVTFLAIPIPVPPQLKAMSAIIDFKPAISLSFDIDAAVELVADGSFRLPYIIPQKAFQYDLITGEMTQKSFRRSPSKDVYVTSDWRTRSGITGSLAVYIIPAFTLGVSLFSGLMSAEIGMRLVAVATVRASVTPSKLSVNLEVGGTFQIKADMPSVAKEIGWARFSMPIFSKSISLVDQVIGVQSPVPNIFSQFKTCFSLRPLLSLDMSSLCPESPGLYQTCPTVRPTTIRSLIEWQKMTQGLPIAGSELNRRATLERPPSQLLNQYQLTQKDQGPCGSCVAMSLSTAAEGTLALAGCRNGVVLGPSEFFACQMLKRCDGRELSPSYFQESWIDLIYRSIRKTVFFEERCSPYNIADLNVDNSCDVVTSKIRKVCGPTPNKYGMKGMVVPSAYELKQWIWKNGPVVAVIVEDGGLSTYWKTPSATDFIYGTLGTCTASLGYHAVVLIGWGNKRNPITKQNEDYWLFHNSWGPRANGQIYGTAFFSSVDISNAIVLEIDSLPPAETACKVGSHPIF